MDILYKVEDDFKFFVNFFCPMHFPKGFLYIEVGELFFDPPYF